MKISAWQPGMEFYTETLATIEGEPAVLLSDFPNNRATLLLLLPTVGAMLGTAETVRCMRQRWDFYHAGVILCVYMDLMALAVIVFLLIYPYGQFLSSTN